MSGKTTKWDARAGMVQSMVQQKLYGGRPSNSYEPIAESRELVREDGVKVITDLNYAGTYPNSFLDLWLPKEAAEQAVPVLVYFHGGGMLFGSKSGGDPLAKGNFAESSLFDEILAKGIAIATADYAFAPEYRFPVQLDQVNEVLAYLCIHADAYHLDADRIFLGGGSAGADFSEIYGLILSDEEYAARFELEPAISADQVCGLIIDEAALNISDFNNDDMDTMLGCWVGDDDLQNSETVDLLRVPQHIKDTYLPTFVTASNKDPWFHDSAAELKGKLDAIDVPCTFFYPDPSEGVYDHGFLNQCRTDPVSERCLDQLLDFMTNGLK